MTGIQFWQAVLVAIVTAVATHVLAGSREKRGRRDELRLQLYHDTIQLILKNEVEISSRDGSGRATPVELQIERLTILYRMKLFGSPAARQRYESYHKLVVASTGRPREFWPDMDKVLRARDELLESMVDTEEE